MTAVLVRGEPVPRSYTILPTSTGNGTRIFPKDYSRPGSCRRAPGAGTAAGALDALERRRFDVVFLDLWLQSESGLTVLPEILRRQPGVGLIAITASATFESAVETGVCSLKFMTIRRGAPAPWFPWRK
jgi:hypothetical protein